MRSYHHISSSVWCPSQGMVALAPPWEMMLTSCGTQERGQHCDTSLRTLVALPSFSSITISAPPTSPSTLPPPLPQVGFPSRSGLDKPFAPAGGSYYWAGAPQVMPNVRYQQEVQRYAQTAYFIACVVTQWANLVVCKTRRLSVFQQVGTIEGEEAMLRCPWGVLCWS